MDARGFVAKIDARNAASRALFARLGFRDAAADARRGNVTAAREWDARAFEGEAYAVDDDARGER